MRRVTELGESMAHPDEKFRREDLKREMRGGLDQSIEDRVGRYLEVAHQRTITSQPRRPSASTCTGTGTF